jgi:hypothetical protein
MLQAPATALPRLSQLAALFIFQATLAQQTQQLIPVSQMQARRQQQQPAARATAAALTASMEARLSQTLARRMAVPQLL